jgi:hypothetical protein
MQKRRERIAAFVHDLRPKRRFALHKSGAGAKAGLSPDAGNVIAPPLSYKPGRMPMASN